MTPLLRHGASAAARTDLPQALSWPSGRVFVKVTALEDVATLAIGLTRRTSSIPDVHKCAEYLILGV